MNLKCSKLEPFEDEDGRIGVVAWDGFDIPRTFRDRDLNTASGVSAEELAHVQNFIGKALWPLPGTIDLAKAPKNADLKMIHDSIVRYIGEYVWIRDTRTYDLLADWVILTYLRPSYRFMPILMLDGTTVSGKTTLMEILSSIVYHGFLTSSFTTAALVRAVYTCDATILCDESLDTIENKDRGGDIMNFLKSATSPNLKYMRAAPKTRYDYDSIVIYTSVCISVKRAEAVEDVINRSIRVQMLTKPEGPEYEHYGDYDNNFGASYEPEGDDLTPKEIRTALYSMKIAQEVRGCGDKVDLTHINDMFRRSLRSRDKYGNWEYGKMCEILDPPRISNRLADIARTLVPLSILTESANSVMTMVIDSGKDAKDAAQSSNEGNVLRGLVDVLFEKIGGAEVLRGCALDRAFMEDIIKHTTTREVASKVNENMHAVGDLSSYEMIKTSTITYALRSMGITYRTGKGAGGRQSTLDPTTPGFWEQLESLIRRYDPDSLELVEPAKVNKR